MAQPRVFISSTCYDLQEIRFQLRSFVEDFGFIPVMSEFGDIFYDYQKHTQDACKDEIEKSQLFLLIIGNNYGSIYYKQKEIAKNPDSVTLQEYKKAIEVDIYKHIFINKFVDYDYKNYQKALNKFISNNIEKQELDESKIDDTILTLKNEFKSKYPFPQDSYKFIFNFMDVIYSLKTNNAIITYESFEDIKESLRKQWAGFMYDAITKSKTVSVNLVEKIGEKIERVENQIKLLAEGQINHENGNPKLTLDISRLTNELNLEEFSKIKEEIHSKIYELLLAGSSSYETYPRIKIRTNVTVENINQWFSSLETIVKKYKWAKTISTTVVFSELGVQYSYYKNFQDIPFELILSFYSLYLNAKNNLVEEDFNGLLTLVCDKFNEYCEPEPKKSGDDLPF